ncbi:protein involved in polysaccharide export with SLBB domain [Azorhizobium sp. AG788]|uniref:polysaccharide biosynthesis/export family protein n=1 Tax=Azorhizobium sp. AG788 TaxID=2183897 RepID=UPI0010EFC9C2|nr:polysaccharide biosynthesis/export family protein [Azorhizobium sp. AG788]TDT89593.1 protein involved in polysaccharide export with SLBB domain [Azorhizobium sp. AG788]
MSVPFCGTPEVETHAAGAGPLRAGRRWTMGPALLAAGLALAGCTTTSTNSPQTAIAPPPATYASYAGAAMGIAPPDGSAPMAYAGAPPVTNESGQAPFATGQNISFSQVNPQGFRPWTNVPSVYRLGPGDKLKVKYFVTRDMDEDITVAPDGTIALRSTGQMRVEGMSLAAVQDAVRRASRNDLTDQRVTVALEDAVSARVFVGGMVARPGSYRLSDMRVSALQAILLAGGFTDEARLGQIAIIRRGPNNEPMLRTVNVRDVIETAWDEGNVPLMAGDIIYVPRSSIAELDLWIDQFINKVVPFQRSFSYTLGSYTTNTTGGTTVIP